MFQSAQFITYAKKAVPPFKEAKTALIRISPAAPKILVADAEGEAP